MRSREEMEDKLIALGIPERMHYGILAYVEKRINPGDFLLAVVENDLSEACGRADVENQMLLFAYVKFFYNYTPSICWGSKEKVEEWLRRKELEREQSDRDLTIAFMGMGAHTALAELSEKGLDASAPQVELIMELISYADMVNAVYCGDCHPYDVAEPFGYEFVMRFSRNISIDWKRIVREVHTHNCGQESEGEKE